MRFLRQGRHSWPRTPLGCCASPGVGPRRHRGDGDVLLVAADAAGVPADGAGKRRRRWLAGASASRGARKNPRRLPRRRPPRAAGYGGTEEARHGARRVRGNTRVRAKRGRGSGPRHRRYATTRTTASWTSPSGGEEEADRLRGYGADPPRRRRAMHRRILNPTREAPTQLRVVFASTSVSETSPRDVTRTS